ncbi:MAG: hypothetical protein RMJ00_06270 [Nitrososphaerota archaeon]|nr:hypothetical protein [Nitrososphaerota archaeon]
MYTWLLPFIVIQPESNPYTLGDELRSDTASSMEAEVAICLSEL